MSAASSEGATPSLAVLLRLPALLGACVEAGQAGVDRPLRWMARVATPVDAMSVGEADLVLLPSAAPGAGAADWLGPLFIRELHDRGIAGIACGAETMFSWLNGGALAEADRIGLPVIALPHETGYRELSLAIASLAFSTLGASVSPGRASGAEPRAGDGSAAELLSALSRGDAATLIRGCLGPELSRERDWPQIRAAVAGYLGHGGNAIAAAAESGVHRHTIRARLKRYEALSGLSLDDADTRLAVSLAFRLAGLEDARENPLDGAS